tara:strand:- start:831 stop:1274 length:444 start_codon:yes stop_codon:yes gene_type:complete
MKLKNILNENWVVIDPRGNASPVGSKIQGDRHVKGKKGYYVILAKHAMKARRAIEKAGGRATSAKVRDLMWDLRYEGQDKDDKEIILGEGKIKSNIEKTWGDQQTIEFDLVNFIKQVGEANGADGVNDIIYTLESVVRRAKKISKEI